VIESAHKHLIESGWFYMGESCGCSGQPKKRKYVREKTVIVVNKKTETYKIRDGIGYSDPKPLSQILFDEKITS
jgi:hypothetical protein